jgi:aryl-alcohol dehydrogenase-like predicted oxidoreductase
LALAQKPGMVPIPGITKLARVEENIGAVSKIEVQGDRYAEALERMTNR